MTGPFGVILAGGQASRMGGGDKILRPLAGRRVIDHVLERLRPQVTQMALNANGDPARFASFDLPVIADSMADFPGPLAGVLAGMDWAAAEGAEHILTVAADTPFFPADLQAAYRQHGRQPGRQLLWPQRPGRIRYTAIPLSASGPWRCVRICGVL